MNSLKSWSVNHRLAVSDVFFYWETKAVKRFETTIACGKYRFAEQLKTLWYEDMSCLVGKGVDLLACSTFSM